MSKVLRSLMVKVGADLSQFEKGMKKMARDLKIAGRQMQNAGMKMTRGLTLPILAAAAATIKFAADFEVSLAKVDTIADTSSKSLKELKEEVLSISDATGVAGTEINEALYQAISAGAETAKATKLVEVAVKAAKGGFTDTTTAVDGLTSTLNTYNMETEEAEALANKYLVTQNKGKTTFGELAGSLGTVAATANAAGVDIDSLLSSVAALTANGIKTEMAVTGVKAALSNIIKPTDDARKVAKELGIDFSTTALRAKGLSGFLQDVRQKTGGNIDVMGKLFGSVKALNAVMTLTGDSGMAIMNDTMAEMKTNTTALDDAFETMTSSSTEQFKITVNELKNVAVALGTQLLPVVNDLLTNHIKPFVSKLGDLVQKFKEMSPEQQKLIGLMVGFAAAIGPAVLLIGKMTTGIGGMITRVVKAVAIMGKGGGLISILSALITPAGLVVLALAAIAATIYLVTRAVGKNDRDLKAYMDNLNTYYAEQAGLMKGEIAAKYDALKGSIQEQKNLLDQETFDKRQAHDAAVFFAESEYQKNIAAAQESHDKKVQLLDDEMQTLKDNYNERISQIKDEYGVDTSYIKSKTDVINDEYSKQKTSAQSNYAALTKAAGIAHDKILKALDDEYNKQLKLINLEASNLSGDVDAALQIKLDALQAEIDAIDAKTDEEEKLAKEQRENEKIGDLESRILKEEDIEERKTLQKELADYRNELAQEQVLLQRETDKQLLIEKQESLTDIATTEKEQIEKDAIAKRDALKVELDKDIEIEGANYKKSEERLQTSLSNKYIALEGARDDAIRLTQEARIAAEEEETKIYDAAVNGIADRLAAEDARLEVIQAAYKSDLDDYAEFQNNMTELAIAGIADRKAALDTDLVELNTKQEQEESNVDLILGKQKQARAIEESNRLAEQDWTESIGMQPNNAFQQLGKVGDWLRKVTGQEGVPEQQYATGTNFHPGGLALVGERGAEVVNLPRGSSVTPVSELDGMGGGIVMNITQNITDKATADYANADLTRRLQSRGAERSFR